VGGGKFSVAWCRPIGLLQVVGGWGVAAVLLWRETLGVGRHRKGSVASYWRTSTLVEWATGKEKK
jgi:hypothetical protein